VGTEVFVDPTALDSECGASGSDATSCPQRFDPVLRRALAEDPFLPRQAVGLVDDHARFVIDHVDCGGCEESDGAVFDITLRPPQASRLPWLLKTPVTVASDLDLGVLAMRFPVIHQGQLRVTDASCASPEACVLPGALLSAYVLIDDRGDRVTDPTSIARCTILNATDAGTAPRCARTAVKVAETRTDDTGSFELLLPATLD
jgi:hypothetical protein